MRISALLLLALLAVAPASATETVSNDRCGVAQTEVSGGFTLQVASFTTRAAAERIKSTLPGAWISQSCSNGSVIYRVNFGRFDSRNHAVTGQWDLEDILAERPVANVDGVGHIVKL
ncbi:MAG: SPOR domain-containing protein [Rhodothermales bacterium]|nr:SPOR domain-containing protein [Rhodothermales bacterium]